MVAALASIAVYGLIGIVLLVMLIRAKWRRAGLWSLGVVIVLALVVPLLTQAWQLGRLWAMERHEIVGSPPDLSTRTPLVIASAGACDYGTCSALLWGRDGKGVYVVAPEALADMDLTKPILLSDLPLELSADRDGAGGEAAHRNLSPSERLRAVAKIDYLIVVGWGYYLATPGAIEAALRQNTALANMGRAARVELLMAPLDPGAPLSLAALRPDFLDLSLTSRALAIPLAPMNTQAAGNSPLAPEVAANAMCPTKAGTPDLYCLELLNR